MRVALATCGQYPDLDDDDRSIVPELAKLGIHAEPAVWDDDGIDWDRFDLVVVRSTWDYPERREAFLDWAARVPRLANNVSVLRWNTDKRYLEDLAGAGVPVVPTRWLHPGDAPHLPPDGEYVLKPSVGAGSRGAARFQLADTGERRRAEEHARSLLDAGSTVMVQPYLSAVDTAGETALLFIGGAFSHAIRKAPLLEPGDTDVEGLFRAETITARTPSESELAVAEKTLAGVAESVDGDLLYARVDLVPGPDGDPVLLEVELTEPSLFLARGRGAAARFAAAIGTRLDRVLKTG